MFDVHTTPYHALISALQDSPLADWANALPETLPQRFQHGDLVKWTAALRALPENVASPNLNADAVAVAPDFTAPHTTPTEVRSHLMAFHPWRKGPFHVIGQNINTEWHSDWKWSRVAPHISPLQGRKVLDVGSGNGYYAYRMAGQGAHLVLGLDPMLLYVMQWQVIQRLATPKPSVFVLPFGIDEFPAETHFFDTVFSMGVLYHRRSPIDHLLELKSHLAPEGELVLETLIVEGDENTVLMPEKRYAQMRNVWFLPSILMLERWLRRCGFREIHVTDVTSTSTDEQRSTEWMTFQSLSDFLSIKNSSLTIEGYPAPCRATLVARL